MVGADVQEGGRHGLVAVTARFLRDPFASGDRVGTAPRLPGDGPALVHDADSTRRGAHPLIRSGYPRVPAPILERRRWVREHADHAASPCTSRAGIATCRAGPCRHIADDADIAVLFMHNEGYSTMCGHGVIALTTGLIEEGPVPGQRARDQDPMGDAGRAGHGDAAARRARTAA